MIVNFRINFAFIVKLKTKTILGYLCNFYLNVLAPFRLAWRTVCIYLSTYHNLKYVHGMIVKKIVLFALESKSNSRCKLNTH